ncbi:hypothetical protein HQ544_02840 [Candidatus Falkowbacteria bacterium]|nr:hypothetical protein [Candidatus Falkowbacteria bacterium]
MSLSILLSMKARCFFQISGKYVVLYCYIVMVANQITSLKLADQITRGSIVIVGVWGSLVGINMIFGPKKPQRKRP